MEGSFRKAKQGKASEFDKPRKGLELPKQVEALLALLHGLREVILELDLSTQAPALPVQPHSQASPVLSAAHSGAGAHSPSAGASPSAPPRRLAVLGLAEKGQAPPPVGAEGSVLMAAAAAGAGSPSGEGEFSIEKASRRFVFIACRLQQLLQLSSKESTLAFLYSTGEALRWTQRLMLKLWSYLIGLVEHMPYRHQPALFDTLHMLMLRGELDSSAMLGADISLLERYKRVLWETTSYVISKLSRKAAPTEVRAFCSHALSITFFRLPELRSELLSAVLPDGENRFKHVREWNLTWSLQKAAIRDCEPTTPGRLSDPRSWRDELTSSRSDMSLDAVPPDDAWRVLWATMRPLSPALVAERGVLQERALAGKYWRERLNKRGHCFFLFLEHWVRHVRAAVCAQPGEAVVWRHVPGYARLVKAFLLEMRQRAVHMWPESMRSCMCALLHENPQLLQVFVRVLLGYVSGNHLRPTLAAMQQLSALLTVEAEDTIHSNSHNAQLSISRDGLSTPGREGPWGATHVFATPCFELLLIHLKLLLESHHFKVVACALIFVYNHVDALGEPVRLELLQWLHEHLFARLCLHWSRVVRSAFLHIVVLKVLEPQPAARDRPPFAEIGSMKQSASHGSLFRARNRAHKQGGANAHGGGGMLPGGSQPNGQQSDRKSIPRAASMQSLVTIPRAASHQSLGQFGRSSGGGSSRDLFSAAQEVEGGRPGSQHEESKPFGNVPRRLTAAALLPSSANGSQNELEAQLAPSAREIGYSLLRAAYEESLVDLERLADTSSEYRDDERSLNDGQVLLARRAYARFAAAEYRALHKRWEEMQEMLSRMGQQGGGGGGDEGRFRRRQLTLSMNIICDDSQGEDDDDGKGDEW